MSQRLQVLVAAVLVVLCALLATQLRLSSDLTQLLPGDDELATAFDYVKRFGTADTVLVEVDGTGVDSATLERVVEELGSKLASDPMIDSVLYKADVRDGQLLRDAVAPHAVALIPQDQLAERISDEGIAKVLQTQLHRLAGPGGSFFERGFRADPLDLTGLALHGIQELGPHRVRTSSGYFLHEDQARAVLFVTPKLSTQQIGPDSELVPHLERTFAEAGLPVTWLGGHRMAHDAASNMRDDVQLSGIVGGVLLLLLCVVGLRSARPVLGSLGPLLVVVSATAAAAALASPIHGINLGFSAALLGLSLDYWIHLYVEAARLGKRETFAERLDLARSALAHILPALAVSAASTAGAFLVLTFSRYPVVQTLGFTGAAAASSAFLATWLLGPSAVALFGTRGLPTLPRLRRIRWMRPVLVGFSALAALYAVSASFDGDPRKLLSPADEIAQAEQDLTARYGGFGTRAIVAFDSATDDILDEVGRAQLALEDLPGVSVVGVGPLLPGPQTRASRAAELPTVEELQARIDRAAESLGFVEGALDGAAAQIHTRTTAVPREAWSATPLASLVQRHVDGEGAQGAVMLNLVLPSEGMAPAVEALVSQVAPSAELIVPARLASAGLGQLTSELQRMGAIAGVGIVLLLLVRYRDPVRMLAALTPCAMALVWTFGVMSALEIPWNAVSVSSLVIVLGLGLDYGVFVLEGATRNDDGASAYAVTLSALTTAAGFGVLLMARSPALHTVGLAVLVGMAAALISALLLVPAMARREPVLGRRMGAVAKWAAALALIGVNLDHLGLLIAYNTPPDAPEPPPWSRVDASPHDRRVGPNRLIYQQGVWTQYLEGGDYERGYASGLLGVDLQGRLEDETRSSLVEHVPWMAARWAILRGSLWGAAYLDQHFTEAQRLEIGGTTDADPQGDAMLAPAYTRRVYYHAIHDLGQAMVDSPFVAACTGFMAGDEATQDGHWLLARNFDFEGSAAFDRDKVVSFVRPDDGLDFVSVSFINMAGVVTGMNEDRLAVALQAAGTDAPIQPGMPMTLVAREILQHASSLDEAEAILQKHRGFVSENLLIVDGDAGEAALFEVSPVQVERLPVSGSMGVANHFRHPGYAQDETNKGRLANSTTGHRLARVEELLTEHRGALDLSRSVQILRDRKGFGGTELARGHRWALDADIATHSVAMDVTAGTLWVSRYPNTAGGYVEFSLRDGLDGRIEPKPVLPPSDVGATLQTHQARQLLRQAKSAGATGAERLARRALSLTPGHPLAHKVLAEALAAQGRREEALEHVAAALAGPPEYQDQLDALQALQAELAP